MLTYLVTVFISWLAMRDIVRRDTLQPLGMFLLIMWMPVFNMFFTAVWWSITVCENTDILEKIFGAK